MESLNKNVLLENNPNNIKLIRKTHGLDEPAGCVESALTSLNEWVKSQNHFRKKNFPMHYLEATLIASKGQTEKAKAKLENLFVLRTELPQYFGDFDIRNDFNEFDGILYYAVLPKLTKDNARIFLIRNIGKSFRPNLVPQFVRILIMMMEYLKINDLNDGFALVCDMTEVSMLGVLKQLSLEDVRIATKIIISIFGSRIKGIHLISSSRLLNILIWILKQVIPTKLVGRIHAHRSIKGTYSFVDSELLPLDYGGQESSLEDLHERWQQALASDQFRTFQRNMCNAIIAESPDSSCTNSINNMESDETDQGLNHKF